jgi:predicted pyridoxine 5'-phosphate oxidase superfamily flavin-nucleotide-binding protein
MTESHHPGVGALAAPSPFHAGELAQQRAAGVAERAARLAPMLREQLTEQQRDFFPLLPFVIVGSVAPGGQPSASLLAAPPGFAWSPTPGTLRIETLPLLGDPLEQSLEPGAALGVLGIEPHTRRRNRVNGRVVTHDASGLTVAVDQAFGNCPKYIHPRELVYGEREPGALQAVGTLGPELRAAIAAADTFFIATAHPDAGASSVRAHGIDVSHRGGPPGFVFFTGPDTFIVPDYSGNNLYNTLGNLHLEPRAGLLFVDTTHGDLLQVSATATLETAAHPFAEPRGSGRVVSFRALGARFFPGAARLRVRSELSAPRSP